MLHDRTVTPLTGPIRMDGFGTALDSSIAMVLIMMTLEDAPDIR